MKKLEKKLETLLEKTQPHTEKSPEIEVLNKISHHLETLEEMVHQHIDDKDFLRALKKLKSAPLLEELKSAHDPAFVVRDFPDIKEKILAWLKTNETDKKSPSLGDIFQGYLEKCES